MAISLEEANRMVEGAIAKAKELNIKINVAVCDAGGRLVAFNRMDGAIWGGAYGSQGKAVASAAFGRTSGELQERASSPIVSGILNAEGNHGIASQGGAPVIRKPTTSGNSMETGWPSITASASMPPTPQANTPSPLTMVVWLSVPTTVSG